MNYKDLPLIMAEAMMIHGNDFDVDVWNNIYISIGGVGNIYNDNDFLNNALEVKHNLIRESYLPEIPPKTLRITHSTGLRVTDYGTEIVELVRNILKYGLQSQSSGSGRHSELPSAVFALVDYPPGSSENRLYNRNYPWITADIPFAILDPWYAKSKIYSGSVVTLTSVPAEYIIAVNGLPKNQWRL